MTNFHPLCYILLLLFSIQTSAQGVLTTVGTIQSGTTIGQGNDCSLEISNDYYFIFTPDIPVGICGENNYIISLCNSPSSWDSRIYVLDGTDCDTANEIGYDDDGCAGLLSTVTVALTTGVPYTIYVEGYDANEGDFELEISLAAASGTQIGNYVYIGDAVENGDCFLVTQNLNGQTSCVWSTNQPDFSQPFSQNFTINLGNNDGGADGLVFLFQNDPAGACACGTTGGSLGYSGANAVTNSIALEIDTYMNTEDRDDFSFPCDAGSCSDPDHVAIHLDGDYLTPAFNAEPLMNGAAEYNIENGLDHLLTVSWDGASLTYTITDVAQTTTFASMNYTFNPLVFFGTNTPFLGFTGSTGGLSNEQSVCFPACSGPIQFIQN